MGCDIHPIIERRTSWKDAAGNEFMVRWQNAGTPELGRNYELFAVLAGVRNHDGIEPVAEPRGLPGVTGVYEDESGFKGNFSQHPCYEFEAYYLRWQGDAHSESWVTLAEIKAYDAEQTVDDRSVISERNEDGSVAWTARGVWRGGRDVTAELERVGQRRIFTWPGREDDTPTVWESLIAEMERVKRDGDTDDDIRLVFFFDN